MRRAARKDANHGEIVAALRAVGAAVKDVAGTPGLLDLWVGYRGRLHWLEVKDGAKPRSRQALTEAERATIETFERVGAPVYVVTSKDEALKAIGAVE